MPKNINKFEFGVSMLGDGNDTYSLTPRIVPSTDKDTIIDTSGPALVRTGTAPGRGWDYVYVRDGRADDTVLCGSSRTVVVADRGDRVRGRCGAVILQGPVGAPNL